MKNEFLAKAAFLHRYLKVEVKATLLRKNVKFELL
jgi:hypothetical protein